MRVKGLLEIRGDDGLIKPFLSVNGERRTVERHGAARIAGFPHGRQGGRARFSCTYLTPLSERAFGLRLEARNAGEAPAKVNIGVEGRWDRTLHEVNETAELALGREVKNSAWNACSCGARGRGCRCLPLRPSRG
jgi:hypothetical protein